MQTYTMDSHSSETPGKLTLGLRSLILDKIEFTSGACGQFWICIDEQSWKQGDKFPGKILQWQESKWIVTDVATNHHMGATSQHCCASSSCQLLVYYR